MILLIDNYDSFVYNLYQYIAVDRPCEVIRNDKISVSDVIAKRPAGVVLSPGPGHPRDAGICLDLIPALAEAGIPMLGVCLGHQSLACAFGGELAFTPELMHGKVSAIEHQEQGIFNGLPSPFTATRYHSLMVDKVPAELEVTARTVDGIIMGLKHRSLPLEGLQFHPESLATEHGKQLIRNFLAGTESMPTLELMEQETML